MADLHEDFGSPLHDTAGWTGVVPIQQRNWQNVGFAVGFWIAVLGLLGWGVGMRIGGDPWTPIVPHVESHSQCSMCPGLFVGSVLLSLALVTVWLMCLRFLTIPTIWFSFIAYFVLFLAFAVWLFFVEQWFLAILMVLLAVFIGFYLIQIRSRIPIAAIFIRDTATGIFQNKGLTFLVVPFTFLGTAALGTITVWSFSWAVQRVVHDSSSAVGIVGICFGIPITWWVYETGLGVTAVSISHVFAQWYHARHSGATVRQFEGLFLSLTKSFGAIAFGALIITGIRILRELARQGQRRSQQDGGIIGLALTLVFCCFGFIMSILEAIVRYINQYAMVYVAIHGEDFWTSGKMVFRMFGRSNAQNFVNDIVAGIVINVGCMIGLLIVWGIMIGVAAGVDSTHALADGWAVAGFLAAFLIFMFAAQLLSVGVDAMFVSYFEDCERARVAHRPIHATPDWHDAVKSIPTCPDTIREIPTPTQVGVPVRNYGPPPSATGPHTAPYGVQAGFPVRGGYGSGEAQSPTPGGPSGYPGAAPVYQQAGYPTTEYPSGAAYPALGPGYPPAPLGVRPSGGKQV